MVARLLLAAGLTAVAVALGGCSADPPPPVRVDAPVPTGAAAQACTRFLDSLPDRLAGLEPRAVTPSDAPARAWGEEGLLLTCDVPQPEGFTKFARCDRIRGVGWYLPSDEYNASGVPLTATAVGYEPRISLRVPAAYRGDVSLAALSDLADYVKPALRLVQPCR